MITKHFITTFALLLCIGCATQESSETINNNTDTVVVSDTIPNTPTEQESSLHSVDQYQIKFVNLNSQDCDGLELMIPPKEKDFIDKDTNVIRKQDSLIFTLDSGDTTILVNQPYDEKEKNFNSTAIHHFIGSVKRLNHWEVFVIGYERHYTVLINKSNGKQTVVIGRPVASPNTQLVICGNPDLEAGYTINGFDILNYREDKLIKVGRLELFDWGPYEASWKNDSVAIIKKGILDKNFKIIKSCVEMIFIEKDS